MTTLASPEKIAKAARLPVIPRGDGSYSVQGDSGTWSVYRYGEGLRCSCPVGSGTWCSHRAAVQLHEKCDTTPRPFNIDALTGEDIAAMDAYALGSALNATVTTIIALARERQTQNTRLADLRVRAARFKALDDKIKLAAVQDEIVIQRAVVDNLRIRASAAKDLKSALQSTMRSASGAL